MATHYEKSQNYETIDKFSISDCTYVKLSKLLNESQPHFVVAFYRTFGSEKNDDLTVTLTECHHFIGDLAEFEATSYFCACIPDMAEDVTFESLSKCSTYKPERDYYYTPERQLQEDENRNKFIQACEQSKSRTAHLRHR